MFKEKKGSVIHVYAGSCVYLLSDVSFPTQQVFKPGMSEKSFLVKQVGGIWHLEFSQECVK